MELRIDTGSGGVDVNAPGASIREYDDVTIVRMKDSARTVASSTPAPAASTSTSSNL